MHRVEQEVVINAPLESCYKAGIAFEQYSRFLNHIKTIQPKGVPNVWHWELDGPGGQTLEWDVEIVGEKHQNKVISWHTVRHGDIAHSGAITFRSVDASSTVAHIVVEFAPASEAYLNWKTELEKYGKDVVNYFLSTLKRFVEARSKVQ